MTLDGRAYALPVNTPQQTPRWHRGVRVRIYYRATTDAPPTSTLLSTRTSTWWRGRRDIEDHRLQLHAGHGTRPTSPNIPTREIAPVAGTPFDFTSPHPTGELIAAAAEQLGYGLSYDHDFVLDQAPTGQALRPGHRPGQRPSWRC